MSLSLALARALAGAAALAAASTGVQAQPDDRGADRIKAHVAFLADDLLQGREAGTPGFDIAAAYVASQLAQLGVQPGAADGTYFQRVSMVAGRSSDEGALVLTSKAAPTPWRKWSGCVRIDLISPTSSSIRLKAPMPARLAPRQAVQTVMSGARRPSRFSANAWPGGESACMAPW